MKFLLTETRKHRVRYIEKVLFISLCVKFENPITHPNTYAKSLVNQMGLKINGDIQFTVISLRLLL